MDITETLTGFSFLSDLVFHAIYSCFTEKFAWNLEFIKDVMDILSLLQPVPNDFFELFGKTYFAWCHLNDVWMGLQQFDFFGSEF